MVLACLSAAGCTASTTEQGGVPGGDLGGEAAAAGETDESGTPPGSTARTPVPASTIRPTTTALGSTTITALGSASTARSPTTGGPTTLGPTMLAPPTGWDATDAHLRERLSGNGNRAASFAISIDGEIVHTVAFGARSQAEADPVEPTDRFRIASISKTITAITMLQLVEDGLVGLDEAVGPRLASALGVMAVPGASADITVRQLLTHTSGFAQYENLFFGAQVGSCHDAAVVAFTRGLQGTPGAGFRYSNMNYCVIGLLIEELTGAPYERAVYQHVLTPLGISGMRLAPTHDPGPDEVEHFSAVGRNYMEVLGGAGAWVATPSDLVKIIDSLDLTKPGWKPLDETTLVEMQTSGNDPLVPDRGYGFGLLLYGGGAYGHTGTVESTHAMVLDRNDGVTWALTVSGEYPSDSGALAGIVEEALVEGGFVPWAPPVLE